MKFQFCVDGRPAAPIRDNWEDAAQDAVSAGYATWGYRRERIHIDYSLGGEIVRK